MAFLSSVGTIQEELATRLNEVSATEADVYLRWINLTTQDINTAYPYLRIFETSSNFTVSAGTRAYGLPSNFRNMYSVWDETNGWKLEYVTKQEYDALIVSGQIGNPTRYTINQEDIEFLDTPGSSITYRIEYRQNLTDVSAASAVLPIQTRFLEAYVFNGMKYGLERRGDYVQASVMESRYQAMLQRMIEELKDIGMKRIKSSREFRPHLTDNPIKNTIWSA